MAGTELRNTSTEGNGAIRRLSGDHTLELKYKYFGGSGRIKDKN